MPTAQGWVIDSVADTITFNVAPPVGVGNIVITETATAAINATDVWAFGSWNPGFGYPAEVEFFADRLNWACTYRQPQTLWMSKSGQYVDLGKSVPLVDTDAVNLTINARQVNAIRELVPLSELMVMTTTCEWKLTTDNDGVVSPGKVGFKPQTFWGCGPLPAVVVGESAIFVQRNGQQIRDLAFEFADDKYKGNDLSIYASHLFKGRNIVDLCYQQHPYSCLWLVLDNGTLVSLTYVREQEVVGWALHDTQGLVKRVCVVPEGLTDVVYVTVLRTNGAGAQFLSTERMVPRNLIDQRDAFFVDCGLTYNGRAQAGTMTITKVYGDFGLPTIYQANASLPVFSLAGTDIGDVIRVRVPKTTIVNGESVAGFTNYRVQITGVFSTTSAQVLPLSEPLEGWSLLIAYTDWEFCRDTIGGLDHLEGRTVSILGDAYVYAPQVVVGGQVTLNPPAAVVQVGLGYTSLIESLDLNVPGAESTREKFKQIKRVTLLVEKTRGVKSGPNLALLDDFKVREFEGYEDPLALASGILQVNTSGTLDKNGRFVVVQTDPLPVTILSMIPEVIVTGTG